MSKRRLEAAQMQQENTKRAKLDEMGINEELAELEAEEDEEDFDDEEDLDELEDDDEIEEDQLETFKNGLKQKDDDEELGDGDDDEVQVISTFNNEKPLSKAVRKFRNQQRVLILSSRGSNSRHRHLLKDLRGLLPHHKKDPKFDMKDSISTLNEIADLKNCNTCIYLEIRRKSDCYLWMSRTPNGPSARFWVENIHTLEEMKLMGNCLLGSRPIVTFDKHFDENPRWMILKEMFTQIFATPRGHPKSKPFIDHAISFFIQDERIWFRNYQIVRGEDKTADEMELMEIGPRFVLNPIRIFLGSFGGPTLWKNTQYVSPNEARIMLKKQQAKQRAERLAASEHAHSRHQETKGSLRDAVEETTFNLKKKK